MGGRGEMVTGDWRLGYNAAMVMRWLMRGVCLVLLAGVVGVGAGSYAGGFEMHKRLAGRHWGVGAVQGLGCMARSPDRDRDLQRRR